jgi:hypothetical protein
MTFQLQIDKNSFRFHIIYMGMKPLRRTPQRQQANQKKRDISNEVRKGTFLKRFDTPKLTGCPRASRECILLPHLLYPNHIEVEKC